MSSTTQVTSTSALKSIPSNRFHDVIAEFISAILGTNPIFCFGSLSVKDPGALEQFFHKYSDQIVPLELLSERFDEGCVSYPVAQFIVTLFNIFLLDDEPRKILLMDSEIRRALKIARSLDDVNDVLVSTPSRKVTPTPTPFGLDEQVVPTFSTEFPEYTPSKPSGSRTVTFKQSILSPPSTPYKQQLKRDSKPQSTPIDNGKKLKQKATDNTLKNGNVIITGYIPQDQEQAQLLDLVVYDILAKWNNYTLLANLGRWGKVISVSTRVHKKYLSVRIRLIPDHECLKCYNRRDWTVNLGGIPVRWFSASWNLSERKQREKF
ncbi:hypothetical protein RclHR1_03000018 [Rhizophagus clarus]|uniref:Uncharacterized protein n=1 Tax=Rhizophagus clarus TaxID=94130 RepID=A0A2Z6R610_9GLOM|nr:hypothetical protein RclHR1_03000018 [Rhizophagus clarus]